MVNILPLLPAALTTTAVAGLGLSRPDGVPRTPKDHARLLNNQSKPLRSNDSLLLAAFYRDDVSCVVFCRIRMAEYSHTDTKIVLHRKITYLNGEMTDEIECHDQLDSFLDVPPWRANQAPQGFNELTSSRFQVEDLNKVVVNRPIKLGRHHQCADCSFHLWSKLSLELGPVVQR